MEHVGTSDVSFLIWYMYMISWWLVKVFDGLLCVVSLLIELMVQSANVQFMMSSNPCNFFSVFVLKNVRLWRTSPTEVNTTPILHLIMLKVWRTLHLANYLLLFHHMIHRIRVQLFSKKGNQIFDLRSMFPSSVSFRIHGAFQTMPQCKRDPGPKSWRRSSWRRWVRRRTILAKQGSHCKKQLTGRRLWGVLYFRMMIHDFHETLIHTVYVQCTTKNI